MISRTQHSTTTDSHNVSFLYDGTFSQSAKMIEQAFLQDGYNVNWLTLKGNDLSHEHVVSLLDLDTSFFEDISEADFIAFRTFMATSAPKSILWITRGTQMRCADPRWSLALGMMRTLRLEFSIPCATFEMVSVDQATLSSLVKVQQKIQSSSNSALDPDYEYSSEGERVFTSRYYPGHLSTNRENAYEHPESKKLTVATCGLLDTIQWVRFEPQLPGSGELEIDIKYVGLNFKVCIWRGGALDFKEFDTDKIVGSDACHGIYWPERRHRVGSNGRYSEDWTWSTWSSFPGRRSGCRMWFFSSENLRSHSKPFVHSSSSRRVSRGCCYRFSRLLHGHLLAHHSWGFAKRTGNADI